MKEIVTLSAGDMLRAGTIGLRRQIESMRANRMSTYGAPEDSYWQIHVEGALGEFALARYLGQPYEGGVNTFAAPDVGRYQVRTRRRHNWGLIVRPHDRDEDIFVLVTGQYGIYAIQGWCYGWMAKKPEYWATHGARPGAYFVPADALQPLATLPRPKTNPVGSRE